MITDDNDDSDSRRVCGAKKHFMTCMVRMVALLQFETVWKDDGGNVRIVLSL